jgi:transcriptional regulator with XRE-family HTH domain
MTVRFVLYYGQYPYILSIIADMPHKPPIVFPQERRLLAEMGERLRLARLRRKLSNAAVAQRAGISRSTLYKVEAGDPGTTLGSYIRVLAALGLENDLQGLAADDKVGRKLQDLALEPSPAPTRRKRAAGRRPRSRASSPRAGTEETS